jgi:hypothetical protein
MMSGSKYQLNLKLVTFPLMLSYKYAFCLGAVAFVLQGIGQLILHRNGTCASSQSTCSESRMNATLPCEVAHCKIGDCVSFSVFPYTQNQGFPTCSLPTNNFALFLLILSVMWFAQSICSGIVSYWKEKNMGVSYALRTFGRPIILFFACLVFLVLFIIPSYVNPNYSCNGNSILCTEGNPLCATAGCYDHQCLGINNAQWNCSDTTRNLFLEVIVWFAFFLFLIGGIFFTFHAYMVRQRQVHNVHNAEQIPII